MKNIQIFENYAQEYDAWFDDNKYAYASEIQAVKKLIPKNGTGVEIGVGTGRFAVPLGIKIGVEPAKAMADRAQKHGVKVYDAKAEKLPFDDDSFDFVLMVTTICFLQKPQRAFEETKRILKSKGHIIIGMIDKNSSIGKSYESKKKKSKFYRYAHFYSVDQIIEQLRELKYHNIKTCQTLFTNPKTLIDIEPMKEGYGEGGFVVISAQKEASFPDKMMLDMPIYKQTTPITCGPASLLMVLKFFKPKTKLSREEEIMLWRESTLGMSPGTCRFGLATAAVKRGLKVSVSSDRPGIAYECAAVSGLRTTEKAMLQVLFQDMKHKAIQKEIIEKNEDVTVDLLKSHLAQCHIPIVLINAKLISNDNEPHWVVMTGYDTDFIFINDPLAEEGNVRKKVPVKKFQKWLGYKGGKCVLFVHNPCNQQIKQSQKLKGKKF
ncbi:MAG: peptidase C39 family protein [Candidatus Thermoplasmatota archaeon]|nr:peptidase C39 family protein [Candidatus Thermoplasmatota archaeon]